MRDFAELRFSAPLTETTLACNASINLSFYTPRYDRVVAQQLWHHPVIIVQLRAVLQYELLFVKVRKNFDCPSVSFFILLITDVACYFALSNF